MFLETCGPALMLVAWPSGQSENSFEKMDVDGEAVESDAGR